MATETAPAETPTPPKIETRVGAPPSARNKAAVLAEMEAGIETKPEPKPDKEPAKKPEPPVDEIETDPDPEIGHEEPPRAATGDDKGLERIKAAEKRMRTDVAKERDALERERESFKAEAKQLEQQVNHIRQLAGRVKYDPVGVLKALGATDDDMEDISRLAYAASPKFAQDPKNKEAAQRYAAEKEYRDKVHALEEEQKKIRAERDAERETAQNEKRMGEFIDAIVRDVSDEAPMVKRLVEKHARHARADLQQVAEIMAHETGAVPANKEIVAMLERVLRDEAEAYGYEAAKPKDKPPEPKKPPEPARPTVNGTTPKKNPRALRDELVGKLVADDLT